MKERYEELYREWSDCMSPWDDLTQTQKTMWIRLFMREDNEKRKAAKAYETLGRVIAENPNVLPIVEG